MSSFASSDVLGPGPLSKPTDVELPLLEDVISQMEAIYAAEKAAAVPTVVSVEGGDDTVKAEAPKPTPPASSSEKKGNGDEKKEGEEPDPFALPLEGEPTFAPSRMFYLRYLRGTKGNVEKAVKNIQGHRRFRREVAIWTLKNPSSFPNCAKVGTLYRSAAKLDGRPVVKVFASNHDKNDRDLEEFKKFIVWQFHSCTSELGPRQDERLAFVFYMSGFSVFRNMDYQLVKLLVGILQMQFPDTLEVALIVDAPFMFNACWAIIKPWLDPITAAKVRFVNAKECATLLANDENAKFELPGAVPPPRPVPVAEVAAPPTAEDGSTAIEGLFLG